MPRFWSNLIKQVKPLGLEPWSLNGLSVKLQPTTFPEGVLNLMNGPKWPRIIKAVLNSPINLFFCVETLGQDGGKIVNVCQEISRSPKYVRPNWLRAMNKLKMLTCLKNKVSCTQICMQFNLNSITLVDRAASFCLIWQNVHKSPDILIFN